MAKLKKVKPLQVKKQSKNSLYISDDPIENAERLTELVKTVNGYSKEIEVLKSYFKDRNFVPEDSSMTLSLESVFSLKEDWVETIASHPTLGKYPLVMTQPVINEVILQTLIETDVITYEEVRSLLYKETIKKVIRVK
jgi:hypothetical protein